jgi:large subunit ribosomal protein L4
MAYTLNVLGSSRTVTVDLPEPKESVLFEVVNWQLSKRRQGSASVKTRGTVSGTTAKMYAQKGTGRARHGSYKAPIFIGGGVAFGPHPRDYSYTLPKKVRKLGLKMALSTRAKEGKLTLVDSFSSINGKTKEFVNWAKQNGIDGKERILLVTDNDMVRRAARNVPWVGIVPTGALNVYDILKHDRVVADASILEGGQE